MSSVPQPAQPPPRVPATGSSAPDAGGDGGRPNTGIPAVDEALRRVDALAERPVAEHHETLSAAHEALHDALQARPESGS